ncbi:hypothetical protein [Shewanella sp.]|uniref:hypothetical protein n=1 Tax=Shewanella sp. TaxID=50422 RepID=UPI00356AA862
MNLLEYYTKKRDEYERAYLAAIEHDADLASDMYREFESYSKMVKSIEAKAA